MGFVDEFKKSAMRGNMFDMAVVIAIGAASNGVVNSLVNYILMPPIGFLMGGLDFGNYFISLTGQTYATLEEARAVGAPTINYGVFVNNVMNLFFIALALFMIVRWFNRTREEEKTKADAVIKECPYC